MITGADQGAVITLNGGASWSSWYNQSTGQFYRLAVDERFPYRIYSGQQDSGTVAIARTSSSPACSTPGRTTASTSRSTTASTGRACSSTCPTLAHRVSCIISRLEGDPA